MYTIHADGTCLFDDTAPDREHMALSPKLTLTAGAAGSLTLTLPVGCEGYDTVALMQTTFRVEQDGAEIWRGRALTEQKDIYKSRMLMCEGTYAWLNDTVQPTATHSGTATAVVGSILSAHNASGIANSRKIYPGQIRTDLGTISLETDYGTTMEAAGKLVSDFGGIMRVRRGTYDSSPEMVLDWLADYPPFDGTEQGIEFGENLLDFTQNWDLSDYATKCYVRGGEIPNTDPAQTAFGQYTLPSADTYGVIEKFLNYSDLVSNQDCVDAAEKYLTTQQFAHMVLSVTALDLHLLDPAIRPFSLLQRVSVSSWAHGMSNLPFAVIGMEIPLDDPGKTSYTLGDAQVAYVRRVNTLTQKNVQAEAELNTRVDEEHAYTVETAAGLSHDIAEEANARQQGDSNTLQEAKNEIASTMNKATKGYIFIDYNDSGTQGIYITDSPITSISQITPDMHVWKWTASGFGYSNDGGQTYEFAADMQGRLNANMILTGLMLADRIKLYGDMSVYDGASAVQASGWLGYGAGHNGAQQTKGIHMYVGTNEVICTGSGVRISCGGYQIYVDGNGASINCPLNVGEPLQIGKLGYPSNVTIFGNLVVTGTINGAVYPPAQS